MFLTSNVRPSVFLPRNDRMSHDFSFVIIAQSVGAFLYCHIARTAASVAKMIMTTLGKFLTRAKAQPKRQDDHIIWS